MWNWHREGLRGQVTNQNKAVPLLFESPRQESKHRGGWSSERALEPWGCRRGDPVLQVLYLPGTATAWTLALVTGSLSLGWWDHLHSPCRGVFVALFLQIFCRALGAPVSRPDTASVPASPLPTQGGETLQVQGWDPPSQQRGKTQKPLPVFCKAWLWGRICTSKVSPLFVPYSPRLTLHPPPPSPASAGPPVALETRLRLCFTKEFSSCFVLFVHFEAWCVR